jgi:hypothetical protein
MNKHLIEYLYSFKDKPHKELKTVWIENLLYYCGGNTCDFKNAMLTLMYADMAIFQTVDELSEGIKNAVEYGWDLTNVKYRGKNVKTT